MEWWEILLIVIGGVFGSCLFICFINCFMVFCVFPIGLVLFVVFMVIFLSLCALGLIPIGSGSTAASILSFLKLNKRVRYIIRQETPEEKQAKIDEQNAKAYLYQARREAEQHEYEKRQEEQRRKQEEDLKNEISGMTILQVVNKYSKSVDPDKFFNTHLANHRRSHTGDSDIYKFEEFLEDLQAVDWIYFYRRDTEPVGAPEFSTCTQSIEIIFKGKTQWKSVYIERGNYIDENLFQQNCIGDNFSIAIEYTRYFDGGPGFHGRTWYYLYKHQRVLE